MRAKIALSFCILCLIAYTLFLFIQSTNSSRLLKQNSTSLTEIKAASLSQEIQIETLFVTAKTNPEQAISSLKQFMKDEPTYMNQCHEIAHEIGHISYEYFGERAFTFKDPLCGGGYLHGLLEEATIFDDSMSLKEIVHTVCSGEIEESCLHGHGHAIYKSVQNVPAAITYCDKVRTKNKDCYDGVYMELFDIKEETVGISIASAGEICNASTKETKSSCIFYLPRLLKAAKPEEATAFCSSQVNTEDRLTCAQGSGVMFMKYAISFEIETVTRNCELYTDDLLKEACTKGAHDYYIYGNVTNTEW